MTNYEENSEIVLKKTRLQILYPHINHMNSFQNITDANHAKKWTPKDIFYYAQKA